MGEGRWPKVIFNERMSERKKSWMRQNNKWMQKSNIYFNACPTNSKDLKSFLWRSFVSVYGERVGEKEEVLCSRIQPHL